MARVLFFIIICVFIVLPHADAWTLSCNMITSNRPDDKSTILDVKVEETAPAAPATAAPADKKAVVDPLDQTGGQK